MEQLLHNANLIQFIKYALAGGLATACHILFFHLTAWKVFPALQPNDHLVRLLHLNIRDINDYQRARNSMLSNFTAFMFSNMVAYITNILWVFESGRHHIVVEILLFYAVSAISMAIGTSLMGILIKKFGILTTYAFGTNIVTAVMINYAVRKFIIFQG
jgi:putative flippase GtrA